LVQEGTPEEGKFLRLVEKLIEMRVGFLPFFPEKLKVLL